MKSSTLRFTSATITAALLLAFATGCSKEERVEAKEKAKDAYADTSAKAKEMYADSKAAIARGWDKFKHATFDKKGDLEAEGKALAAQMDAQASKLRAEFSDAKASASRKAAMAELKNAEADYKQKLSALGSASADTWESAKNNTISAWDKLEAAYRKALVD